MKSNIVKLFAACSLLFGAASCNYLDVSDELAGGITDISEVFDNVSKTEAWYGQIFDNVPDMSRMWNANGVGNIWSFYADELYSRIANNTGKYQDFNSSNKNSHRWSAIYESIRQANIFLEMAKPINAELGISSGSSDVLPESTLKVYKANARFMRAFYHFYLMELYGPIPIVDHSFTREDNLDIPRAPLDSVINFIDRELLKAIPDMQQEPYHDDDDAVFRAVPTRGVALALRAKLWVYAASPLYNGGFPESLSVTNKDGVRLFPDEDPMKWQKAVEACEDFFEYAEEGNRYELYDTGDPDESLYELFQVYNKEIIWSTAKSNWGALGDQNFESMITPRCEPKGLGGIHVVQELVDAFYMNDGLPIQRTSFLPKSPNYTESGFGTLDGYEVSNMYIGREPRFYNTITFSGKKWHMSGTEVQFYKRGNADNSVPDGAPLTGYLLYKRACREVHQNATNGLKSKFRAPIIFRLGEFCLLYAEAVNEVDPSDPRVLKYLNAVRNRAGLPNIEALNPAIVGNKELQRAAIQRESRIELATEGQRYFDVRRWMIAETEEGRQGGEFHGMDVDANKQTFHTRKRFQTRSFQRKNYWYPVPLVEMQRSQVLVQNPGWQ